MNRETIPSVEEDRDFKAWKEYESIAMHFNELIAKVRIQALGGTATIATILTELRRAGSMIVTSNRGPEEWLATFADPMRAQSAIDRFTTNAYDLIIESESYRRRQKPMLQQTGQEATV